jgi:hypothetical protein
MCFLQVVIIDTIVMETGDEKSVPTIPHSCAAHDYDLMKPVVLATWKHGFQGACPDKSAILAESQVTNNTIFLVYFHMSNVNIVHTSIHSKGCKVVSFKPIC